MWRCQREKLKEDAIQCCGKKQCEKIYLDSVATEGEELYKVNQYNVPIICGDVAKPYPGIEGIIIVVECDYERNSPPTTIPPIIPQRYFVSHIYGTPETKYRFVNVDLYANISVINYPPYKTNHSCTTITDTESTRPGKGCCPPYGSPCDCLVYKQKCIYLPEADPSLLPKTAEDSKWFGKTVFTNATNCKNQHGEFKPYTIIAPTTDPNYKPSSFYGNIIFKEDPDKSIPCINDSPYCKLLKQNINSYIKNGYNYYNYVMVSDVGLCTVK